MWITDFLGQGLNGFPVHKVAKNESGYNYYGMINRAGIGIILREKTDETEYLFANAGNELAHWGNRANLSYVNINKVVL